MKQSPIEIEIKDIPSLGWVTIEIGEENVYFTNTDGKVFFTKEFSYSTW